MASYSIFKKCFAILVFALAMDCTIPSASAQQAQGQADGEFNPTVTATCRKGIMTISVNTQLPFYGVVHAKYHRKPECMVNGLGSRNTTFVINLLAEPGQPSYCGINFNNATEERSVPIAVRTHRTLELADDKYYFITCGRSGYIKNSRNETSLVSLKLMTDGNRVRHAVYGQPYILRADLSKPDGTYAIKAKNCFSFSSSNESVRLIREDGCSERPDIISEFTYNATSGFGEAEIYKMFRFPDSSEAHFQCDIVLCRGPCRAPICDGGPGSKYLDGEQDSETDAIVMASTNVFVLEPGDSNIQLAGFESARASQFSLKLLCIILAVLLVVMIVVNVFLCFAMSCSCTKAEVIEKEPSIIEDYDPYKDPYKVTWNGSQYGSRYSLNEKAHGGYYASGGSTRSLSSNSDHYAIVHSRPESRYSAAAKNKQVVHPGPGSTAGSYYSGQHRI